MLGFVRGGGGAAGRRKSRHPGKGVIPPCPVIVGAAHRLAELAVVGNVDANLALLFAHIGGRRAQGFPISACALVPSPLFSPTAIALLMAMRFAGRDRLPAWVVRIRSVLCLMIPGSTSQ